MSKTYNFLQSPFVQSFLQKWQIHILCLVLIFIVLSSTQIYILQKDPIMSIVHSFLIANLISL